MGVSNVLHVRVKKLIPEHKRIVLDLSDLSHMDSSGLGTLVGLFVSARSAGCSLELLNLSHGIQKVLSLTNLLGSVHGDWGERHQDWVIPFVCWLSNPIAARDGRIRQGPIPQPIRALVIFGPLFGTFRSFPSPRGFSFYGVNSPPLSMFPPSSGVGGIRFFWFRLKFFVFPSSWHLLTSFILCQYRSAFVRVFLSFSLFGAGQWPGGRLRLRAPFLRRARCG